MPRLSVVVPNWNGKHLLGTCLSSLRRSVPISHEVIVVDNGSSDGSVPFLEENFPEVRCLLLEKNFGFARACNEGIRASTSEYVCLLNNDVEVDARWMRELVEGMERHPECGMGASKMYFWDEREVIYNAGDCLTDCFSGRSRGFGERDAGQYEKEEYVFGACAGAGIYRRSLFEAIGLFDNDFFIFAEDVDFNVRARVAGFPCIYLPRAKVYHRGTATVGFHSDRHVYLSFRNEQFVLFKNFPFRDFVRTFGQHFRYRIKRTWEASLAGQGHVVFFAQISFLKYFFRMMWKRKAMRAHRPFSLSHLENIFIRTS